MKKVLILSLVSTVLLALSSCGGGDKASEQSSPTTGDAASTTPPNGNPSYDPNRGEGKFKEVQIGEGIDASLADAGSKVVDVKCSSCHKLTNEKLVGPGWKGVTKRHTPVWIMNFITNTDAMIDKDPAAQAQLEICMVRMPNQSLSDDDARHILEFMRKNDAAQ